MKPCVFCAAVLLSACGLLSPVSARAQAAQTGTRDKTPVDARDKASVTRETASLEGGSKAPSSYRLGPDDQIAIHALDLPDISDKPQRLDPNGDIRLPLIGRIHAGGMTVEELENELIEKFKAYLREPDVSIAVTELRSQPVAVLGAVGTPGVQQLEGRRTLVELLSLTGGLSADAGPTVRITRRIDQGPIPLAEATEDASQQFSTVDIDVRSLLDGRNPEKDIVIQPHDVVLVPRAEVVYVIGEVGKPGPVPLSSGNSISVTEAVSSSGGVLRTGAPKRARILRRVSGEDRRTELNVDIHRIMQGKANDVPLAAGDVLIVPDSNSKRATTRILEAAIQAGVMIGGYALVR
jgi:polysaccharide export outer membrane protein